MKYLLIFLGGLLGIFLFVVLPIFGWFTGSYNSAISLREEAKTQQAQIEAQLQRRSDLIPNLVAATKGAMKQEKAVFENISKAQAAFTRAPSGSNEKIQAGEALGTAIRGYMVVAQQYPDMKSLDIMKDLQVSIEGTENRISVSRQRYNESVRDYNKRIQSFPLSLFAQSMGFSKMEAFEAQDTAKVAPVVKFED